MPLRDEGWGSGRVWAVGELAVLLGEVKRDAIVGAVAPQRSDAMIALKEDVGDRVGCEACRRC